MRTMDLMASWSLVTFLHVQFMWCASIRFLSKIIPKSRTFSVSSRTPVLSEKNFSMLGVLVNRDVNNIISVFSALLLSIFGVFHSITSSMQVWRAVRDWAWFAGLIAIYNWVIDIKQELRLCGELSHPTEGQYTGRRVAVQVWTLVGHHNAEHEEWKSNNYWLTSVSRYDLNQFSVSLEKPK